MIKSNAKRCSNVVCVICNVFLVGVKFALQWSTFSSISWRKVVNDGGKLIWGYDPPHPFFPHLIDGDGDVSKTHVTFTHSRCVCRPMFELLVSKALKPHRSVWMCRREGGKARPTCRRWRWGMGVDSSLPPNALSPPSKRKTNTQRHIWYDEELITWYTKHSTETTWIIISVNKNKKQSNTSRQGTQVVKGVVTQTAVINFAAFKHNYFH